LLHLVPTRIDPLDSTSYDEDPVAEYFDNYYGYTQQQLKDTNLELFNRVRNDLGENFDDVVPKK
jgi:hypothetical protein